MNDPIEYFLEDKYDKYGGSNIVDTRVNKIHKNFVSDCKYDYKIRIPSLKRNKRTWNNFYTLFPELRGLKTYNGIKLKMI